MLPITAPTIRTEGSVARFRTWRTLAPRASLACLVILLSTSCDLVTGPEEPHVRLELKADRVVLPSDGPAVVAFAVRNRGSRTAHVTQCGDEISTALDRMEGREWEEERQTVCFTDRSASPLVLEPGETGFGSLPIGEAGTYRIRVWAERPSDSESRKTIPSRLFVVAKEENEG